MLVTRTRPRAMPALFILVLFLIPAFGGPTDPAGHWQGSITVAGQELKIIVDLNKGETSWTGKIAIPAQGLKDAPLANIVIEGRDVSFELPGPGGKPTFKGTLSEDGETISGPFVQGATQATFALRRISPEEQAAEALRESQLKLDSMWLGTLKVGAAELRLFIKVYRDAEGKLSGKLDSVDQGAKDLEIPAITVDGNRFSFEMKIPSASYEGTFNEAHSEIAGQWSQSGQKWPLTFAKTDQTVVLRRPQEPKAPFPYQSENVTYENAPAGIRLAGTLTFPKRPGPFPAVVLITGSGPQDRDETLMGHKPFLVLADFLTRHGVAVLRSDDRGVGGSTGNLEASTSEDLAADVESAVKFLQSRTEIDPHRIGLIGHSEGGMIAPIVAARSSDVAFIVLLAGTGVPGEEILNAQLALILKVTGSSPEAIEAASAFQHSILTIVKEEKDRATAEKLLREKYASLSPEQKKAMNVADGAVDIQIRTLLSPWFKFFVTYDPRPTLKQVRCPVLALNGSFDLQVPAKDNLPAIAAALKEGGNKDYKTMELQGLNHLFQPTSTGSPTEYGQIEETMSTLALDLINMWITEHTMPKS